MRILGVATALVLAAASLAVAQPAAATRALTLYNEHFHGYFVRADTGWPAFTTEALASRIDSGAADGAFHYGGAPNLIRLLDVGGYYPCMNVQRSLSDNFWYLNWTSCANPGTDSQWRVFRLTMSGDLVFVNILSGLCLGGNTVEGYSSPDLQECGGFPAETNWHYEGPVQP
jgi:hypothetical protein